MDNFHELAQVIFQKTHVDDTPYMSICKVRGKMAAFSLNTDGTYNNLICFGYNMAEVAGLMLVKLVSEKKIEIENK